MDQIEHDGVTYGARKLGLQDALDVLERLQQNGFFSAESELHWLMGHREDTKILQRKVFGPHLAVLNEQGDFVPLSPELTNAHFQGRTLAYFVVLTKALTYQLSDFLAGGQATDPEREGDAAA